MHLDNLPPGILTTNRRWSAMQFDCLYRFEHYRRLHIHLVGHDGGWRRQNTAEHTIGLHELAYLSLDFDPSLDGLLLHRTISRHDRGEINTTRKDVNFTSKLPSDDVAETVAFHSEIASLPDVTRQADYRAFLLQFALDRPNWHRFPPDAQAVLFELAETRLREAALFKVWEFVDYAHYELDNWQRTGQPYVLTWGLRVTQQHLPPLLAQVSEFTELLWPADMQRFAERWLAKHTDIPDERVVAAELDRLQQTAATA